MQPPNIRDRIRSIAFEQLGRHPTGLRFSHLVREIGLVDPKFNASTIKTVVWALDKVSGDQVYKPMRGLLRLVIFKDPTTLEARTERRRRVRDLATATQVNRLFADWLRQELQDVDQAITPASTLFRGLCGTPTVLGLAEEARGDEESPPSGIVSAQIEPEASELINAFGHACAARLFSRRSYLVVSKRQEIEPLMQMHELCRLFGLGLILFNDLSVAAPGFRLAVRAVDHVPDPVYESRCMQQLEAAL